MCENDIVGFFIFFFMDKEERTEEGIYPDHTRITVRGGPNDAHHFDSIELIPNDAIEFISKTDKNVSLFFGDSLCSNSSIVADVVSSAAGKLITLFFGSRSQEERPEFEAILCSLIKLSDGFCKTLKEFYARGPIKQAQTFTSLFSMLTRCPALELVHIYDTITWKTELTSMTECAAEMVTACTKLRGLEINWGGVSDECMLKVAAAIGKHPALDRVSIYYVRFNTAEYAKELAALIAVSKSLKYASIWNNAYEDEESAIDVFVLELAKLNKQVIIDYMGVFRDPQKRFERTKYF